MIYNILQKDTKINQLNNTISQTNKTVSSVNSSLSSTNNSVSSINSTLSSHRSASNPHGITKATIGLGNVDNTSDSNKSVHYSTYSHTIVDDVCTFTPEQIKDRFKRCMFVVDCYQQEITLAPDTIFFQTLPSQYQKEAYIFLINCSGNSCNFICNMEKYNMAVKNIGSVTLTTTVQVYIFAEDLY